MTRINLVPVTELHAKHLVAEYRELPRIFGMARLPRPGEAWPKEYVLGAGHMKFFFDKLDFLMQRQGLLIDEMTRRGYNPAFSVIELMRKYQHLPSNLWNNYSPDEKAIAISRNRLNERLKQMGVSNA